MNARERSLTELTITLGIVVLVVAIGMADSSMLMVIDDPNVCAQPVWIGPAPFAFDPNIVHGLLIDCHQVSAGKFNRVGRACDPDGDPIDVELLAGPAGMTVTIDAEAAEWMLAGELPPGLHAIVVRATDRPVYGDPNETIVTVLVKAVRPPNQAPVLY